MHEFRTATGLLDKERLVTVPMWIATSISVITTIAIVLTIVFQAIEFFRLESFWYFLGGTQWYADHHDTRFGSLPIFAGTWMITLIALLVAIPVGIGNAIYLSSYARPATRNTIKPVIEILAGIPSVVYGFFAALTVAPLVVSFFSTLGIDAAYNNALACGVVMGVMIIPVISSLSDDVLTAVPSRLRNAALALGMTEGETIRDVVLPAAAPGLISAALLGFSKAIGETMIVVMAAGMRPNLTWNPLEDMTTVTVQIVDSLVGDHAFDSPHTLSAFALGLVLFVITFALNIGSLVQIRKFKKRYQINTL
ncbi:MAG: phosphate ABC transporter permease subunit PstC [Alcanivoracaceae bacterium]|jgi:phosphate transport system permease protein|nr:phosphate ABC transporter permease subunit PstC [Alcanivoracaceae bacterium]